jgi:hypothetical protein
MYYTVDMRKALVNLAMDEAFLIPLLGFGVHRRAVGYVVLDKIGGGGDQRWCFVTGHDEDGGI